MFVLLLVCLVIIIIIKEMIHTELDVLNSSLYLPTMEILILLFVNGIITVVVLC